MSDAQVETPRRRRAIDLLDEPPQHVSVDVGFRAAEPELEAAPTTESVAQSPAKLPKGWFSMDGAPEDGKCVWLMGPDGEMCEALYRHTRQYDRNGGKWREVGFWAVRNSGGTAVPFEPIGFRPI